METLEKYAMIYFGALRSQRRANREFAKADLIRQVIQNENWTIEDIPDGEFRLSKLPDEELSVTRDHV
jgi:cysteinyl-tRNA synthetase